MPTMICVVAVPRRPSRPNLRSIMDVIPVETIGDGTSRASALSSIHHQESAGPYEILEDTPEQKPTPSAWAPPSTRPKRRTAPPTPQAPHESPNPLVSGALGLLGWAGSVTLQTTGKLVTPPLFVVQNIVSEILHSLLPPRVRDWLRIFVTSGQYTYRSMVNTPPGQAYRHQVVAWWGSVVRYVLCTHAMRNRLQQFLVIIVRLGTVLHADEAQEWMHNVCFTCMSRPVAIESVRLFRAVTTLWTDPTTTAALAEVTAYICQALAMEQAVWEAVPTQRTVRQEERRQRQAMARMEQEMKLEDCILQRLGVDVVDAPSTQQQHKNDGYDSAAEDESVWESTSIRQQVTKEEPNRNDEDNDDDKENEHWTDTALKKIDVEYLRRKILEHAQEQQTQNPGTAATQDDDDLTDVENVSAPVVVVVAPTPDDEWPTVDGQRHNGESAADQFQRIVTESLEQQQQQRMLRSEPNQNSRTTRGSATTLTPPPSTGWTTQHWMVLLLALVCATVWFFLGCYGLYVALFGGGGRPGGSNEMVIRIVHNGGPVDAPQVASCVAQAATSS